MKEDEQNYLQKQSLKGNGAWVIVSRYFIVETLWSRKCQMPGRLRIEVVEESLRYFKRSLLSLSLKIKESSLAFSIQEVGLKGAFTSEFDEIWIQFKQLNESW